MKVGNVQLPDGTWRSFWNERDLILRRVVLGVSWPAERPGHIVVVGEGLTMRPPYLFHVLSEAAAWTAAQVCAVNWRDAIQTIYHKTKKLKCRIGFIENRQGSMQECYQGEPF